MNLVIGLFNHTQQRVESITIDVSDVQELIDNMQDEVTLECVELEGNSVAVKSFDDLCSLVFWLEDNPYEKAAAIVDYVNCFSVHDLDSYHDSYTGYTDFSEYAAQYIDDCILCDIDQNHPARSYFNYKAFERDLAYDFTVGIFVWYNV